MSLLEVNLNLSKRVNNHIFLSFLLKGISIILSFLLIPITLKYLGNNIYGVWVVLLSIMSWIGLMDIGIGNGLRNKLAENLASRDLTNARINISTAYIILALIGVFFLLILISVIPLINWQRILNISALSNLELKWIMIIYFSSLIISFILSLINSILAAFQLAAFTNITSLLNSVIFIILLKIFSVYALNNLLIIVSLYCGSLILSNLIVSFVFFFNKKELIPSLKFFNKRFLKGITNLGGSFFIIQVAVILIFTTDNYLILKLLGAKEVTTYNIVFKLFSIFTIASTIILTPMWSAFTVSYYNKDYLWIKKKMLVLNYLILPLLVLLCLLIIFYQEILDFWLPTDQVVHPPLKLIISLSILTLISFWNNIYANFLNGISETKLQIRTAIFGAIINIPLSVVFVKFLNLGLIGIVSAMCFSLLPFSILGPIKSYKLICKIKDK